MKRFIIPFLLIVLGCSEEDPSTPCESNFTTGISLSSTFTYSRHEFVINGKFCKAEITKVLLNAIEVTPTVTSTSIKFIIPAVEFEDSAAIQIQTTSGIIDLEKKIKIFPYTGEWTEVASFPDQGRSYTQKMIYNNLGYLSGGNVYTGYDEVNYYNFTYFNSLYSYNPESNAWSLVDSDDNFKDKADGVTVGDKFFLTPETFSGSVTTYQIDSKEFTATGSYSSGSDTHMAFAIGSDAYMFVAEDTKKLVIKKYNTGNNTWVASTELAYTTNDSPYANFAFEYEGIAYIGYNFINLPAVILLTYDPVENALTELSTISVPTGDFPLLHHLFTINGLAYFIEKGSSSLGETSTDIWEPGSTLYIYNLKGGSWRTLNHSYPETFFGIQSFSINNRGFAGLSVSTTGGPLFTYSQKFYEFTPTW